MGVSTVHEKDLVYVRGGTRGWFYVEFQTRDGGVLCTRVRDGTSVRRHDVQGGLV